MSRKKSTMSWNDVENTFKCSVSLRSYWQIVINNVFTVMKLQYHVRFVILHSVTPMLFLCLCLFSQSFTFYSVRVCDNYLYTIQIYIKQSIVSRKKVRWVGKYLSFLLNSHCADLPLLKWTFLTQTVCSVCRNPPRFQTSTPMRKHGPTTCLAWTPAGAPTPRPLPCRHGRRRRAARVQPTPDQKVRFRLLY